MKFNLSITTKTFLTKSLFAVISAINKLCNHKPDKVLFYNNVEFKESNKALFDYMIENHYNSKYTIICHSSDYKKIKKQKISNVKFVGLFRCIVNFFSSSKVFYCIGHLPINAAKDQEIVQMWHGTPLKDVDKGSLATHPNGHNYYTKVLSSSEHFIPMYLRFFNVSKSKVIVGGMPRNEALYAPSPKYDFGKYNKLIIWTPTFRKSFRGFYDTADCSNSIIPILTPSDFESFNELLISIGVKIIVKLHPAQDLGIFQDCFYSHLKIYKHQAFIDNGYDLYRLLVQSDALITDYSSIYFDYLLLNKPIGFTVDDMDSYSKKRGFVMQNPESYMPGRHISVIEDLKHFCHDVASEIDVYREERIRVNNLANDFKDGLFCKRLLDIVGVSR